MNNKDGKTDPVVHTQAAPTRTAQTGRAQGVYTQADLQAAGFDPERDLGAPGEYPFTRGIQPSMYRGRLWVNRLARTAGRHPRLASWMLEAARWHPGWLRFLTAKVVS